jgi:molybdopterin converting factor small subunit
VATVTFNCFSVVRDVVGARSVEVEVGPPETARGLFGALFARYGQPLRDVLVDPETGELTPVLLVVNGEAISSTHDMDRPVRTGDEITLVFPIGGGQS